MTSTYISNDDKINNAFTRSFNNYSSMVFSNGFILGLITGSTITSIIFITFKRS